MPQKDLEQIREEINQVDDTLAQILVKRANLAKQVRDVKKITDTQVYQPSRERNILDRVYNICKDSGFSQDQVSKIFLAVISACRSIVGDLEVAIPSTLGGIAHAALVKQFGPIQNIVSLSTTEDVVKRVQTNQSPYGILPVSMDRDGVFNNTLFSILSSEVSITVEVDFKTHLSLCGQWSRDESVDEIYIPEDLFSIIDYQKLTSIFNKPKLIAIDLSSTLGITKIAEKSAILLPDILSQVYPIPVLKNNLSITKFDSLRYFIIGKPESNTVNHNVMALVCVVKDRSGALRSVLEPFERNNITLLSIESRTSHKSPWESVFYIECECKGRFEIIQTILRDLEKLSLHVRSLGSFYRGVD